jgi:hypothetical protein
MIDPKENPTLDEEEAAERKPELESEKLKDLTTSEDQAEGVRGGETTPAVGCECGTA